MKVLWQIMTNEISKCESEIQRAIVEKAICQDRIEQINEFKAVLTMLREQLEVRLADEATSDPPLPF